MADFILNKEPQFQIHGLPDSIRLGSSYNLLQDCLLNTGHVEKAIMLNAQDGSVIDVTVGLQLSTETASQFVKAFKVPSNTRRHGLRYNGVSYECIRAEFNSIYCKNGNEGIILVQTKSLVIVAFYNQQMHSSVAIEAVEALADYLREKGK